MYIIILNNNNLLFFCLKQILVKIEENLKRLVSKEIGETITMVKMILSEYDSYIDILSKLLANVQERVMKSPILADLPLKKSDVDNIQKDIDTVKNLPFMWLSSHL